MSEAEWAACTDPMQMLAFLLGRASVRKFRLFAVAAAGESVRSYFIPSSAIVRLC